MHRIAVVRPAGKIGLTKLTRLPAGEPTVWEIVVHGLPRPGLASGVAMWRLKNLPNLCRGAWRVLLARLWRIPVHYGVLYLEKIDGLTGARTQYGMVSMRVVTTAGVNFIRDAFLGTPNLSNMKYHGFGTGTAAEAIGDTGMGTEFTTEYATDNVRPTGSQVAQATGDYRTVGTFAPDSGGTLAVTEHGVFSATSSVTLLDRSKFAAVNLIAANGDSLQATYDFVVTSGG